MVSWMICRLVVLVFGLLYPAYASYKAVKTKNIREYVRWMMYWIVFALFMAVETFTDIFISWRSTCISCRPRSAATRRCSALGSGASTLLPQPLCRLPPRCPTHSSNTPTHPSAFWSQGALAGRLRSFSMQDLRSIPDGPAPPYQDPLYLEDQAPHRRPPIGYRAGGLHDSDSEDECWSDTEAMSQPPARAREKPLSRSQSLRVIKRKPLTREGTSRSLKVRTRKKAIPSDLDS
ncbi:receptor expression-enhancing protein 4 isoform X2 [Erinaceus europaeus]|uniref:Receptor expression-enhancing protein n=1 Tax=Erinaceus europaeus TaxID=9365 RepID=A0ABM3WDZ4_ERIEU|nr:receptor expression-enhancing protein 4 isoform X2 [Erinaceus europaeus]